VTLIWLLVLLYVGFGLAFAGGAWSGLRRSPQWSLGLGLFLLLGWPLFVVHLAWTAWKENGS